MKRAYYTDPLAASYMARHFRMKIEQIQGFHLSYVFDRNGFPQKMPSNHEGDKYYVHPGSMKLLEPQDRDLIQEEDGHLTGLYFFCKEQFDKEGFALGDGYRVIQRNGTPFMWPEFEE